MIRAAGANPFIASLSATFLRNRIIGVLRSSKDPDAQSAANSISSNFVFEHSNIQRLATGISQLVNGQAVALPSNRSVLESDILAMVDKYASGMPSPKANNHSGRAGPHIVLLTGATGNIGSHILGSLLADERVGRVYVLNRPSTEPAARLKAAFEFRKLPVDLLRSDKCVTLVGSVSQLNLGLDGERYSEVCKDTNLSENCRSLRSPQIVSSVTHIIHNAWSVNFNLPLHFFEDQIAGVRRLVDICSVADHNVRLMVTSSIGVASGWLPSQGPVPENPLSDPSVAASSGYTASKYIVEQVRQLVLRMPDCAADART